MKRVIIIAALLACFCRAQDAAPWWNALAAGGGTAWTPLSLSPSLWLDGSDASTITITGSGVSTWADKSGNGYNMTQTTDAYRPTNGATGCVIFDGSDDFLTATNFHLTYFTICVVACVSVNNDVGLFEETTGGFRRGLSWGSTGTGKGPLIVYGDKKYKTTSIEMAGQTNVLTAVSSESSQAIFVNGVSQSLGAEASGSTGGVDSSVIGKLAFTLAQRLSGKIGEVLVFPVALSINDRQRVESYLGTKWGITVSP